MGHGPPESSPGAAVEALTPEFVQNAIQNTIEALAGLSGPPHPHNSEQPGTSVRDQEGGISEDHPMHPTDEQDDEDEEMADLVPDQVSQLCKICLSMAVDQFCAPLIILYGWPDRAT